MKRWTPVVCILVYFISHSAWAASKVSLAEFLELAKKANLDLKIEQAKTDASHAKSVGIALPPPMVSIIRMKEEDGNAAHGFEVTQSIPFPTKLTSDHSARGHDAEAQTEMQVAREREILASAKILYFSLWSLQEKLKLLEEKRSVLKDHIKLSRSTTRSDSFAAVHLLKSESDLDLLESDIEAATQSFKEKQLEASNFLNQDESHFQIEVTEPELAELPKKTEGSSSHQVFALQKDLESADSRVTAARSAWLPDFSFTYKKMGATSMFTPYSEFTVGVSVPFLFFWEPYSESKRASAERSQKEYELEKGRHEVESKKSALFLRAQSLRKQFEILREKLIPRAEKRMKIVHNLAPRDMETLQDHRETMEAFPDLKMKALDLRVQYEEAVANLQKYQLSEDGSHE